jgi:cytochrome c peroxidase
MTFKRLMLALPLAAALAGPALAGSGQDAILAAYAKLAKAADAKFAGFSAAAGKTLYHAQNTANADTPACASCHTANPLKTGQTRAGKAIDPMAVSASPSRFTDMEKTEKWFGRNCKSVLGRECTPQEKGDYITYLNGL